MITAEPYTKLALIYDRLMDHVDYQFWSDYIFNLFQQSSKEIISLVDLSCGTGSFLSYMKKNVPFVFGSDYSKEMISEAMKKNFTETGNLFVNDIKNIALKDCHFDCALMLYDSLNYLIEENSLNNALHEIQRILNKNGLFIFDIVSEEHCIEHYGDFHESEYWANDGYSRHCFYDSRNGYQFNEFRIVIKGETYIERHQQKIYSIEYLKSVLYKNSFKIMGIYDDFSKEDHDDDSGRLHFLCSKF